MINLEEQENLFKAIGEGLKEKIECFLIGGSAMMYYGAKETTKDIDLLFLKEEYRNKVIDILLSLGYTQKDARILYKQRKDLPVLMEFKDSRLDLFLNKIVSFKMTKSVAERIKKVYEYKKLIIKIVSPEDIILMKCATERAGDRLDTKELINNFNINWEIIIEESINQAAIGELLYPVSLYDFLNELKEDLKVNIKEVVLEKVKRIAEKELNEYSKKHKPQ